MVTPDPSQVDGQLPRSPMDWAIEEGVRCVVAPCCAFTFDAGHTDVDGGYSCPACAELHLTRELDALREPTPPRRPAWWSLVLLPRVRG